MRNTFIAIGADESAALGTTLFTKKHLNHIQQLDTPLFPLAMSQAPKTTKLHVLGKPSDEFLDGPVVETSPNFPPASQIF